MKRAVAVAAALAVAAAITVMAQGKTSFAGTWKRDASRSDTPQMGRGGPGGGGQMGEVTMTITQTAADLTVERKMGEMSSKSVYKLDGSESVNAGMRGGESKSKTHWDGANLIIDSTQSMSGPQGEMTITSKEVWTLGADGALTITATRTTPRGEMTTKTVYTK